MKLLFQRQVQLLYYRDRFYSLSLRRKIHTPIDGTRSAIMLGLTVSQYQLEHTLLYQHCNKKSQLVGETVA